MHDRLPPIQFDFQKLWFTSRREILNNEQVKEALQKIRARWEEISTFIYDDMVRVDAELAQEELDLNLHIGAVKVKDLFWLQKQFASDDLAEVSLAIAEKVYPDNDWEILEEDEMAVVTDAERTIVMDLKYGRELSASASLILAGDKKLPITAAAEREARAFLKACGAAESESLDKMKTLLARVNNTSNVVFLNQE